MVHELIGYLLTDPSTRSILRTFENEHEWNRVDALKSFIQDNELEVEQWSAHQVIQKRCRRFWRQVEYTYDMLRNIRCYSPATEGRMAALSREIEPTNVLVGQIPPSSASHA